MLHKFNYETTKANNGKESIDLEDVYSGDNDDIIEYVSVLGTPIAPPISFS